MIGIRKIEYERKNGLKLDSRIGISKANISDPVIRNDECPKHSNERYLCTVSRNLFTAALTLPLQQTVIRPAEYCSRCLNLLNSTDI